jgi:hypothetical protein
MVKDEKARATFHSMVQIQVGDGKQVLFWVHRWIQGRSTADIAPGITMYVQKRARNARTVAEALQNNKWMLNIQGCVATLGFRDCIRLWAVVSNVKRDANTTDRFTWPLSVSGVYTETSAYNMLM